MIYLLTYDRGEGRIVDLRVFDAADRHKAEEARLELDLNADSSSTEVVLLEAESEQQLRSTHSRYFETATELLGREPA